MTSWLKARINSDSDLNRSLNEQMKQRWCVWPIGWHFFVQFIQNHTAVGRLHRICHEYALSFSVYVSLQFLFLCSMLVGPIFIKCILHNIFFRIEFIKTARMICFQLAFQNNIIYDPHRTLNEYQSKQKSEYQIQRELVWILFLFLFFSLILIYYISGNDWSHKCV